MGAKLIQNGKQYRCVPLSAFPVSEFPKTMNYSAQDKKKCFTEFSELRTSKKTVVLLCVLSSGPTKNSGFTVFSEIRTKKHWFYCVF